MKTINLIGGGLSGCLMAIYLAKRGHQINLYERRPDMRKNKIAAGRSINLALSVRGLKALEKVGLDKEILDDAIAMTGRIMHSISGDLNYQPYGKDGQAIYSVSRGRLNIKLLELADEFENIQLFFNHKCIHTDTKSGNSVFLNENKEEVTSHADHTIGCDGAFAATRGSMLHQERFDFSQSYLGHGYKELSIPALENGKFAFDKNALHIWPRGGFMMIALPNPAGDFTCTLFYPNEGENSFENLKTPQQIDDFFSKYFPDVKHLMPTLQEDFFKNPIGTLVTMRCYPWVEKDNLLLLGDAAHALVPFYGQGMNCSFEDCIVLDECLEKHENWETAFDEYQKSRKPNAEAIADLALQNFIEMRDLVGQKEFLEKKKLEHDLSELYPEIYQTQYELVTFTNTPYSKALERGAVNEKIVEEILLKKIDIKDKNLIEKLIMDKKAEANSDMSYNYIQKVKRMLEKEKIV